MIWVVILVAVILFIVGIISPHAAGKVQYKTDVEAGWLKRTSEWLWDPVTWWAKGSIEMSRKIIKYVAQWGRKTRKKLPF
ncbi:hypothetical protein GII36_03970 [Candidatus Mycosynbacter amalyticus]|uniref:Uncharacterized protein n=1 Tax=Candidatus Mycosynbacter amalyticus TaxID=2665156 RepID=A0A857MQT6_9BACT|nr:hypothetical protein [Candidatus Mycosynbacter amalyticus]QHN42990.1 hypothetical protein GII36_03970 [Candidatus Mycosynbacter amalyticus]